MPPGFSSRFLMVKQSGILPLPNQSVVGCQDIGPIAVHDAVDLQGHLVPMLGALQTLVSAFGLDLAAGVDLG